MLKGKRYSTRFLEKLYEHNVRRVHTKVELLDWKEKPLTEIGGIILNGSYNVDGNSSVRRSVNLTLSVVDRDEKLVFEYMDLSKKVRLWAGLENNTNEHQEEDIIWFNLGTYILLEPSYSHSVQEMRMTLQAQDKMCLLNGVIGGVFNTATSFTERDSKTGYVSSLSWREIFMYATSIFGEEDPARVIVDSVPDYIRDYVQVKMVGGLKNNFIHVNADPSVEGERIIVKAWSPSIPEREIHFSQSDRLFKLRRFGPPDPQDSNTTSQESYIKNAGEPISSVYNDIIEELGNNHEIFYNTNGDIILQKIHHYINDTFDPDIDTELGYVNYEFDMGTYIPDFSGFPFAYDFSNKSTVTAYTNNPSWGNLKNDFIVVGREGSNTLQVAIDKKPSIRELRDWFKEFNDDYLENATSADLEFLRLDLNPDRMPYNEDEDTVPFLYKEATKTSPPIYVDVPLYKIPWQIALGLKNYMIRNVYSTLGQERVLPRWGKECESMIFKWTPSLSKENLVANLGIFNPALADIGTPWLAGYKTFRTAAAVEEVESLNFNDPVFTRQGDPSFWSYFLDIIDENSNLGKYSIDKVGKRTKVVTSDVATSLFRVQPLSLIVMTEDELSKLGGNHILANLREEGQSYAVIADQTYQMFKPVYYSAEETKRQFPYVFVKGDPSLNEQQYFFDDRTKEDFLVGGFYTGQFIKNMNDVGEESEGLIAIKTGDFRHPSSKEVFKQKEPRAKYNLINLPIPNEEWMENYENASSMQEMFICYIRNKEGRMPDSTSNDSLFAVCKWFEKDGWKYLSKAPNSEVWAWKPFNFDKTEKGDVIVGFVDYYISTYNLNEEEYHTAPKRIDDIKHLFNVRESGLVSLFDYTGNVDCLSILRREMYRHTNFAEVITINCLPVYHLEPNTLIRVKDKQTNIDGVYLMTSFNIPFNSRSASIMSINAIKVYGLI